PALVITKSSNAARPPAVGRTVVPAAKDAGSHRPPAAFQASRATVTGVPSSTGLAASSCTSTDGKPPPTPPITDPAGPPAGSVSICMDTGEPATTVLL